MRYTFHRRFPGENLVLRLFLPRGVDKHAFYTVGNFHGQSISSDTAHLKEFGPLYEDVQLSFTYRYI